TAFPYQTTAVAATLGLAQATNVVSHERKSSPVDVARAYLAAKDARDLAAAESLFADPSTIFETGAVEGAWKNYREHHIGPEIAGIDTFRTALGEPEVDRSADSTMAFVAWPIEYRIRLKDERLIESRGTVTFVLTRKGQDYRIRPLHWSSRRKK
ncbi:MAG: nuclear transport factor 2 family protein, partial [Candidatus Eisenbacteria bacterium]